MANLRACKPAGFRVLAADDDKRAVRQGRPYAHAMTGHNLILRDASPPIADAQSHVHAGRGGGRATSNTRHAPTQTEQRQPGRVRQQQETPKASRSPLSSPRIHEHQHVGRRGDQPGPNSSARPAGPGAGSEESGSRHIKRRQPGVTVSNGTLAKSSTPRGGPARNISHWNHLVFCADSSCFISPQGSHALCDGKIVRQPELGIEPEET